MGIDIEKAIASLKGLAGSGNLLSEIEKLLPDVLKTLEQGDISGQGKVSAAPTAFDLWYLWYAKNLLKKYYEDVSGADFNHYNYSNYLSSNFDFLTYLPGLKPTRVFTDLEKQFQINDLRFASVWDEREQYVNNGIYWINTAFFELMPKNKSIQYASDGSARYKTHPNEYVGYLAIPIGQLGVMEVISLFQETDLRGYTLSVVDSSPGSYHAKPAISNLEEQYKPTVQSTPEMFPDMKDSKNNPLAGQNYCYGKHLIESAYYKPITPMAQQNKNNSDGESAYAPVANNDLELWASDIKDYGEDIGPKKWLRYWIHKDSTLPVPGEFIGFLVRPVAAPPHVWWFQESSPFLYAGNWMETGNFTSGIVTERTLEAARTDDGTGDLYKVKIQGCEIQVTASDFLRYDVGDRVAIMKVSSTATAIEKSFTANDQTHLKDSDSYTKTLVINTNYIIVPMSFYKKIN
jgi:hypothetical protein